MKLTIPENFKFSWSKFEAYNNCPYKFYMRELVGDAEPTNIFALYGCAFHGLLDHIYKVENFSSKYSYSIWENMLQKEYNLKWKKDQYKFILPEEVDRIKYLGFKQIKSFFNLAVSESLLKPAVFTEQKVKGKYQKHKIISKIDLGINTKYGFTLIDWKTGKENPHHFHQLMLYAALYQKVIGQEVKAIGIMYIKSGQIYYQEITSENRIATGNYIFEIYMRMLNDRVFEPKKNDYCKYCHLKKLKKCPLYN